MDEKLRQHGSDVTCPVCVIVRDGKILLGHRHYTKDKWQTLSVWTIPGGRCDPGETIEDTLRREVAEEVGFQNVNITGYYGSFPGAKEGDMIEVFVEESDEEPELMEPHKFSEWKWFGLDDWPSTFINAHAEDTIKSLLK